MERAELIALARATGCAIERHGALFLCPPGGSASEAAQTAAVLSAPPAGDGDKGWLALRTGGTGGAVRFARHDEATLGAAARGCAAHFGLRRIDAVDVLPPYHVSGFMTRVRCAVTGGRHLPWEWKALEGGRRPALPAGDWAISLVPTQLQRLLAAPGARDWLRRFAVVFVGGGPLWPELAESAADAALRLAPVYGLTETAAMVAGLLPEEFLAGRRGVGRPLPHARIDLAGDGTIRIAGASVHRGYWPASDASGCFATEDLGRWDEHGGLHVLGRRDAVIITGGRKVQPADVEAALRASGEFDDVAVLGVPDAEWGEIVVACHPPTTRPPDLARAVAALAAYQRPKRFVAVAPWPGTAAGKVNRAALLESARRAG